MHLCKFQVILCPQFEAIYFVLFEVLEGWCACWDFMAHVEKRLKAAAARINNHGKECPLLALHVHAVWPLHLQFSPGPKSGPNSCPDQDKLALGNAYES